MDYVDSLVDQGFHGREDFRDAETARQRSGARVYDVGNSDNSRAGYSLDRASVKFAYVAGSNQSDAKICI
jgi:hypothetical protein